MEAHMGNKYRNIFICSELLGFRNFSIVRYSRKWKTRRFENWICFRPQVSGGKTPIQLGAFSPLTWGRKQIQFPKCRVFYFLEYRTMEKVQKPSNSECYTPSSESLESIFIRCINKINPLRWDRVCPSARYILETFKMVSIWSNIMGLKNLMQ
jgi:hypothetical protein